MRSWIVGTTLGVALAITPVGGRAAAPPAVSAGHARIIHGIETSLAFRAAVEALDRGHDQWIANIIALAEVPAPAFKERARAELYAEMFRKLGLAEVTIDPAGNVLGLRKGTNRGGKVVVVSAHLDTVFPEGTPTKVRREGDRLYAPGVGDDATGLATQISLINAMNEAAIDTPSDILFVGTVGEEGLGNLRGVRYLFTEGEYAGRIGAFFSLDGSSPDEFTIGGLGSRRYRVTFIGPGGHSFGAFGLVNPLAALSQAVIELYKIPVPAEPRTTYSASVVGGGTSVNSIPHEAWMEVDMRSESAAELARLEPRFIEAMKKGAAMENAARATDQGAIKVDLQLIGDRPAGLTPVTADIVQFATAAYLAAGITPRRGYSSTDSNMAMSLGIPAVTFARSAEGGRSHSVEEWVGVGRESALGILRLDLLSILATAGYR